MPTLKPLDEDAVRQAARTTPVLVTAEEHSVVGGLGSAVADVLAQTSGHGCVFRKFGLPDAIHHEIGSQAFLRRRAGNLAGLLEDLIRQQHRRAA
jgi:transketolase